MAAKQVFYLPMFRGDGTSRDKRVTQWNRVFASVILGMNPQLMATERQETFVYGKESSKTVLDNENTLRDSVGMLLGLAMKTGDQAYTTKAQQELSAVIANLKFRSADDLGGPCHRGDNA